MAQILRPSPSTGQIKTATIEITAGLRRALGDDDHREGIRDDEPVDSSDSRDIPQDKWDSNDFFHGDSTEGYDVRHSVAPQAVAYSLASSVPRAQWRVMIEGDGVSVAHLDAGYGPRDTERANRWGGLVSRRRIVLTHAAGWQRAYLETGDIDKLRILTTEEVLKMIDARHDERHIASVYEDRQVNIASDIQGQFFYDPRGALHAVGFLLQHGVQGVAHARVYHALNRIVNEESKERGFLTDPEVAVRLTEGFPGSTFTGKEVSRWRVVKQKWSVKELFLPNREDRKRAVCPSKRQQN